MYHIDNKSGVPDMPPVKDVLSETPLFFTEQKDVATWPGADWFNIVQSELFNILKLANMTPQKNKLNQIAMAIMKMLDNGKVYESPEAGVTPPDGVADGQFFNVISASSLDVYDVYQNIGGIAKRVIVDGVPKTMPSGEALKSVLNIIKNSTLNDDVILKLKDTYGFVFAKLTQTLLSTPGFDIGTETLRASGLTFNVSDDGTARLIDQYRFIKYALSPDGILKTPMFEFVPNSLGRIRVKDKYGFVFCDINTSGILNLPGKDEPAPSTSEEDFIARLNADNLLATINANHPTDTAVQLPTADINVIVVLGQSFSNGTRSQVALPPEFDYLGNLMLGGSPRGGDFSGSSTTFSPVGGNVLLPLQEVAQGANGAINTTGGPYGETISSGLANYLKMLHNNDVWTLNDEGRQFIVVCPGVGGKNLAQLSKGAEPNLFGRFLTAIQGIKEAADTQGKTVVCVGAVFQQGENNGNTPYEVYTPQLEQYYADVNDALFATFPLQIKRPVWSLYQVGGSYATDGAHLAIARAHIDFIEKTPGVVFGGPYFPFPDPGDHMYANSYRWHGCYHAKAIYKSFRFKNVVFRMKSAIFKDNRVLANFEVPVPPLAFGQPYELSTAKDYADKGFTVEDAVGPLFGDNLQVSIVAPTVIKILASRPLVPPVRITLGDLTHHNGNHCIIDSDESVAPYKWVYTGENGQPAGENIPELINKPYPLYNWAGSYSLIATEEV